MYFQFNLSANIFNKKLNFIGGHYIRILYKRLYKKRKGHYIREIICKKYILNRSKFTLSKTRSDWNYTEEMSHDCLKLKNEQMRSLTTSFYANSKSYLEIITDDVAAEYRACNLQYLPL